MLNRAVMGICRSKIEVKSSKSICRGIFYLCLSILFFSFERCVNFKNIPAKFQSRPTFLAGFFSKRVTDDHDRRKTFFLASCSEYSSLIYRVVTMEYRTTCSVRGMRSACIFFPVSPHSASFLQLSIFHCAFELRTFVPDHVVAIRLFFWSEGAVVRTTFCHLIFPVRGKSMVDWLWKSSSPVSTSEIEFTSCRFRRGKQSFTQWSCLVSSQGMIAWRGWSNRKEVAESQFCFHWWACTWIPARRLVREKQEAPHEIDKSTRLLFASLLSLSLTPSLSLSLSLYLSLETCTSFFSSPSPPFPPRPPSSRSMSYPGLQVLPTSSGATSEADLQATLVGCHEYVSVALTNQNRSEARKGNWNFLKKNRKTGKGNCAPARESGVSRFVKTRLQISMVILGSVWFWRHEFLWRHFSRSLCTRFL